MYEMDTRLLEREQQGLPILAAIIGAGQMGAEIVAQISLMKGMRPAIVVDIKQETVENAFRDAGLFDNAVFTNDINAANRAITEGKLVGTTNWHLATRADDIEVVVDCTGFPELGARITMDCISNRKHIVMMNVECDVTIGPLLRRLCNRAGVVYSLTAGDEPGSIVELYRFARSIGYDVVAAGKGKNNPLNIKATPSDPEWAEKAKARKMEARMLIEFVDGSKTMIEMAAVSNATGLVPDVRGMHCAKCNIKDLAKVFSLREQGGILSKKGCVDFAIGDVAPGVFVIVTTQNAKIRASMIQRDMGEGPNYLLYRPYHLCSGETPITIAQAAIYNESTAHPMDYLTSECITIAKRNLKKGDMLDRIGEHCYRGSIELHSIAMANNFLPLGLAYGAKLKCDVQEETVLTYDMVEFDEKNSMLLQLRRIQDIMIG